MLAPRLATHLIVARAASLYERAEGTHEIVGPASEDRIDRWRRRIDPSCDRLEHRCALDDLPPPARTLADLEPRPDAEPPSWALVLETVAGRMGRGPADARRYFEENNPAPFQELLAHFVDEANERMRRVAGPALGRLDEAVQVALQTRLLRYLGWLAAASLRLELRLESQRRESSLARLVRRTSGHTSRRSYEAFVARQCAEGMQGLLLEYASLARALGTAVLHWVEATAELVVRLDRDWDALARTFGGSAPLTSVRALEQGLSDRHDHGRSVAILTFDEGMRVVYKPRPLGIESAWFGLLRWMAADGAPYRHRSLTVLEREGYGWVELVRAQACESREEIATFYQRLGALLAVLHAFEATDCHYENVIAAGPDPVLIDAETVMHPRFVVRPGRPGTGAQAIAREQVLRSVQRPGLLPQWTLGADGKGIDVSGSGASDDQLSDREFMAWSGVNTDDFELAPTRLPVGGGAHAPRLGEATASVVDHQDAFRTGFERMYRYLVEARDRLRAAGGPLRAFAGQRVRVVLRPTRLYSDLLENGNHPDLMRDGIDRSIHFDLLGRPPRHDERPPYWGSVRLEHEALMRLDVPAFHAPTDRAELVTSDGRVASTSFLHKAPLEQVAERLGELGEDDLAVQLRTIDASFLSRQRKVHHGHEGEGEGEGEGRIAPVEPGEVDLVAEAERIGQALLDTAIRADDGSIAWVAHEHLFGTDSFQLGPSSSLLYGGSLGVGLLFASLHRATGRERWREACHAALAHVWAEIDGGFVEGTLPEANGGLTGDGGLVYLLAKVGEHLGDPEVFARAEAVVERIAARHLDDDELDVTKGNAGAILGLLRLHEVSGSTRALEVARACGEHLLGAVLAEPGSPQRRWLPQQERPLAGLSHGAAGFALAFGRLYELHPDPRLLDAIDEALAYERTAFVPELRNWLDLREPDEHGRFRCVSSWCHGAPGIGLARAAMPAELRTPEILEDLEHALAATEGCGLAGEGNACCGIFGRMEAMLTIGRALGRDEPVKRVRAWTAALVAHARAHGGFSLLGGLPRATPPIGLYDGIAGVGMHLLRLHDPESIGAFMLWE